MPTQGKQTDPGGRSTSHATLAQFLTEAGRDFYRRGWVLGTSGNFSAVASLKPLSLAITPSGADKGALSPGDFLEIDSNGQVIRGEGRPSDETRLHLAVVRLRGAGAVMHTHSVWSTLLSEICAADGRLCIEGFEMLKGLAGVRSHEHCETIPVIENSQDMNELARTLEEALEKFPECHGVLLRRHGLYTWGRDLIEARRHVEILEFLLEVVGRTHQANGEEQHEKRFIAE